MLDTSKSLRFAVCIAVGWTALEFLLRKGSPYATLELLDWPWLGFAFGLLLTPIVAVTLTVVARRSGQVPAEWDWRFSRGLLAVGVWGGFVRFGLAAGLPDVETVLFGAESNADAVLSAFAEMTPLVLALVFVGNAICIPIAEEQVWRGVIQTAVVRGYGPVVGVVLTAALFSAKHAVVDLSPGRLVTNFVGGLVYGVVRHYWGTGASTVTHVTGNALSTGLLIVAVT